MRSIELRIFGNPVAQGRPRFFRKKGNFVGTFDPKKSKSWKESIRLQAIANKAVMMQGALSMTTHFFFIRPKSLPKKIIHHVKRPDLDNCLKAVKDALNGICYRDDSQIISLICTKEYSDTPGVLVKLCEMEG